MAILLVAFKQDSAAKNLSTYLNSISVASFYRPQAMVEAGIEHQVWIQQQSDLDQAQAVLAEFLKNPLDNKYTEAAWSGGAAPDTSSQPLLANRFSLKDILQAVTLLPVVSLILAGCLIPFLLVYLFAQFAAYDWLSFQAFAYMQHSGEWWRLLTPTLIHFGATHLVFNLLWWWWLGKQIEALQGSGWLIAIYALTGILSNVAQYLVSGMNFGGLSGVVYALLGYVWIQSVRNPSAGWQLPKAIVGFMLLWLVVGYLDLLWVDMANTAHLVGLMSGIALGFLPAPGKRL